MIRVAFLEYEKETKDIAFALSKIFYDEDWTFRHFYKASDLARHIKKEQFSLFVFDEIFKTPRLESVFVHDHPSALFIYLCKNVLAVKGNDQRHRVLYIDKAKIRQQIENERELLLSQYHQSEFYELNYDGIHVRLPYQDIYYLDKMEKMIYFHTRKGEFHERANMADLEERLADFGFLRVHVSYLVNAKYIVGWFKDEVELSNGDKVPLSRAQKKKILAKQRSKKTI